MTRAETAAKLTDYHAHFVRPDLYRKPHIMNRGAYYSHANGAPILYERVTHIAPIIRPGGGPYGYLHNLDLGLAQIGCTNVITWAPQRCDSNLATVPPPRRNLDPVARRVPYWALTRILPYAFTRKHRHSLVIPDEILRSRVLVFHSLELAAEHLAHPFPGQQVWIMSHAPTTVSAEVTGHWKSRFGDSHHWESAERKVEEFELSTYERSTGMLTPCEAAVDAYFSRDPLKRTRFSRINSYNILSGVPEVIPQKGKSETRRLLGIPETACLIGFAGRYHKDKGFDIFLDAAREAAQGEHKDLTFLSIGDGPLRSPTPIPNYLDLGWQRSGVSDLINAFDIMVSPNPVTYFDLGILEAMSLGVPILANNTGGNRTLSTLSEGIVTVEALTATVMIDYLERLRSSNALPKLSRANRASYEQLFTTAHFARRHAEFANRLLFRPPETLSQDEIKPSGSPIGRGFTGK